MLPLLLATSALATWSVVAADSATGQVGGAGAACSSGQVSRMFASSPGAGAVHAEPSYRGEDAAQLLADGASPEEVIATIASSAGDNQYGVVDLSGRAAGITGIVADPWAGDVQGAVETYAYAVQGYSLTSEAVVVRAEAGFERGGGCDLADRLVFALEAGALDGEGASRCTPHGLPADAAFIRIQDAEGLDRLFIEVRDTRPDDPLVLLREQYDEWRSEHDCPDTGDTGAAEAGCACHSGAAGGWWLGALGLFALVWRRR